MENHMFRVDIGAVAAGALAAVTVVLAAQANVDQALATASAHGGWCGLSGSGQVVLLGHCATCWAALGAGLASLALAAPKLAARRTERASRR